MGDGDKDWADLLALTGASARQPPASLRDRVLRDTQPLSFVFIRREEGIWLPPTAGVSIKALYLDSGDRWSTRLIRLQDGAPLPPPTLGGGRLVQVLEGELVTAEHVAKAGDVVVDLGKTTAYVASGDTWCLEQCDATVPSQPERHTRTAPHRWSALTAGIRVSAPCPRSRVILVDADPGATLPAHPHAGVEELFVLRGSCVVEGTLLEIGDYHRALPGSAHADTVAGASGCLLYTSLRGERVPT
jgi:anti-sigma factor ChrR (cupin superfamily)